MDVLSHQAYSERSLSFRLDLSVRAIADSLHFPVLFFQLPLHLKVDLSLPFDPLLFHVANDALVHSLVTSQDMPVIAVKNKHLQPCRASVGGGQISRCLSHLQWSQPGLV